VGRDAQVTLEAVQESAVGIASAEADAIRCVARERAKMIIDEARAEAAALIAQRRAAAERLADLEEQERLAEARGEARARVLRAQRSVLIDARRAAHVAVRLLVDDPRYERLLERLAADARERLAPVGPVQITALPEGGFVARAGSREIDYSLDAQLDRCLRAMASELGRLWR
jgi:vacuolar-type H+-ATPase subunit E/Vma4